MSADDERDGSIPILKTAQVHKVEVNAQSWDALVAWADDWTSKRPGLWKWHAEWKGGLYYNVTFKTIAEPS